MKRSGIMLVLGALGLSSCVQSAPPAPQFSQVGTVVFNDLGATLLTNAAFFQAPTPREIPAEWFPGLDTCSSGLLNPPLSSEAGVPLGAGSLTLVSGQTRTAWTRQPDQSYTLSLLTLPEAGSTLEIAGSPQGFPAFGGVPVPQVSDWTLTSSALNQDAEFTWTGAGSAKLPFLLLLLSRDASDPNAALTPVVCTARDDGRFSFPEPFKAQLVGKTLTLSGSIRTGLETRTQGKALLNVLVQRTKLAAPMPARERP